MTTTGSPTRDTIRPPLGPLDAATCAARRAAHEARVDALVGPHLARAARGERHPVEDFLFSYYSYRPGQLRRWHPGVGVAVADDAGVEPLDAAEFACRREDFVGFVRNLLRATGSRPAFGGCYALHEWAMVYRAGQHRHPLPLRLGRQGTDAVVEASRIHCSHFDAFRFFTPEALPRNELQPTRATQTDLEQPGCLHATMDLYKWAYKLAPATPSELVVDCFELARDTRVLDMRASPYDVTGLGLDPVRVETEAGRAEFTALRRALSTRAEPLRSRLIDVCDQVLGPA